MKCEICQCELPNGASFCPECGSLQEQRFEKQFKESIKKDNIENEDSTYNSYIQNNTYTQNNTYESDSYNQAYPYVGDSFNTFGRQGVPPISLEDGLSRRDFYQQYQPDILKRKSDLWISILILSIICNFCIIVFFNYYVAIIDVIFVSVILVGYYYTRRKEFVYISLGEKILVFILTLISRTRFNGIFTITLCISLLSEIKKFDIYYKEYLQTGHVSSLNECFRRTTPAKTSKILIVLVAILCIALIGLFYTFSNLLSAVGYNFN